MPSSDATYLTPTAIALTGEIATFDHAQSCAAFACYSNHDQTAAISQCPAQCCYTRLAAAAWLIPRAEHWKHVPAKGLS